MKMSAAITTVRGIRLVVAFPHPSYVRPGVGDVLLARLTPHFPALPIMLVSAKSTNAQAYATFETDALLAALDLADLVLERIDLDLLPEVEVKPPF
ncbi:hypothetical protein [Massilia sp. DD77]|uniref:hypothetical protein n=1 Tax=Massilia sp. DD77 TaxID=3109349 RepID=UPI0030005DBC